MRPRQRVFALVFALVIAYEAYAFFLKEAGQSENIASSGDRHLTGEVAGEATLAQGFVTHADGFDGIDVWAHASSAGAGSGSGSGTTAGAAPRGPIVFEILRDAAESGGRGERVARVSVPAAEVVGAPQPFHVTIPRVDASAGRPFVVSISAPEAARGQGVRFEASGPTYPQGTMTLGGREEWGDLQFRTSAERTTIYRSLRHQLQSRSVPAVVRSDFFLVLMLLLFNAVLATLLYDVALTTGDER